MRQAAVWPLVHSMRFPATLLGCGLAQLGAGPGQVRVPRLARAVPTRAHSPARPELTPPAPPLSGRSGAGAAKPRGATGPAEASRPAAQRGRMPARNVAMPNSRPPSIYRIPTSVYTAGRAPRFISLADPWRSPRSPPQTSAPRSPTAAR